MIKIENLSRNYGDFRAVNNVSFEIRKGEIVGLLGHNGAGKTTIMKMLTGFLEPTEGEAYICGYSVTDSKEKIQNHIGYLAENAPLYTDMTVMQYLDFVCDMRNVAATERDEAVRDVVQRTGLTEKAFNKINTLSKGYKQRVGIAQAIIHKPDILILDEPTNGLDPSQIHEVRKLITDLSQYTTIILSTHILQEVEAICDRVIIILNGEVATDSMLDDIEHDNRLRLTVGRKATEVGQILDDVSDVEDYQITIDDNYKSELLIATKGDDDAVAAEIANKVVSKGWKLFCLERERANLEAVFRTINES